MRHDCDEATVFRDLDVETVRDLFCPVSQISAADGVLDNPGGGAREAEAVQGDGDGAWCPCGDSADEPSISLSPCDEGFGVGGAAKQDGFIPDGGEFAEETGCKWAAQVFVDIVGKVCDSRFESHR